MGQEHLKPGMLMLAVAVLCLITSGIATAYVVPAIEYPQGNRDSLTQSQLHFLRYVLGTDGVVALTNVPGLKEARDSCLVSLGRCYQAGLLRKDLTLEVLLADGTKRTTLAAKVNTVDEDYGCPGLGSKMRTLQTIIDEASKVFGKALDSAVLNQEETPLFMAIDNPSRVSYRDFSSVVEHGDHLDHFHVYEKSTQSKDDNTEALERHTDQGLFVAIVPSITLKNGKPIVVNDGFELELPLPKGLTRVTIPNNGESILFMLGDGILNWISKQATTVPLRSVPHRLVMESRNGVARAWFGRMFFPPKDAYIHKQQTTFDKFRMESVEVGARGDLAYVGCSNQHHILRDLTESACGESEIYCWMGCRPTGGLHCSGNQTIECVNQKTHEIWTDETSHCFDCAASCYGDAGTDDDGKNGTDNNNGGSITGNSNFCNTKAYPTNMYMDGFNGLGPNVPCLIFLFQTWVLDTQVKYAFGSIGAFLIGMLIEFIVYVRRQMKSPRALRPNRCVQLLPDTKQTTAHSVVMILLYGTQLVFAYFAMLLAMSFAAVIFSMVMLGLTFGHLCFNFSTPAKNNEACCAANDEVCQSSALREPLRNDAHDCCGEVPTASSSPTANDSTSTSPAIV